MKINKGQNPLVKTRAGGFCLYSRDLYAWCKLILIPIEMYLIFSCDQLLSASL